jgi:hypothetical protein
MQYRKLKAQEIRILMEEQEVYERWQAYAAFAVNLYGPQAEHVIVESDIVYDDQTDALEIVQLDVLGPSGVELVPDLTTDWWQTVLGDQYPELICQPWDYDAWCDPRTQAFCEARRLLPVPPECDAFAVRTPPDRTFPVVYVPLVCNTA